MTKILTILILLLSGCVPAHAVQIHIATTGNDTTGSGTSGSPYRGLRKAFPYANDGDTIYIHGGTYKYGRAQICQNNSGSAGAYINIWNYPGEKPILSKNASFVSDGRPYIVCTNNISYVYFKGLDISGNTQIETSVWAGMYCDSTNYCKFEQLDIHHNGMGMMMVGNSANNLIKNCDFHHNQDPNSTIAYNNADGLDVGNTSGAAIGKTNTVMGCRAWWNSDDGFDFWEHKGKVNIINCWAFYNGLTADAFTGDGSGDGNGFKLGQTTTAYPDSVWRVITNCLAFKNNADGFKQNYLKAKIYMYNNIAYLNNATGFQLASYNNTYNHLIKNNIGYLNGTSPAYCDSASTKQANNFKGWGSSTGYNITVDAADFVSLDTTGVTGARYNDGDLPNLTFLHIVTGSDLKDVGADVGLYYYGYPDVGAFEYVPVLTRTKTPGVIKQGAKVLKDSSKVIKQ